MNLENPSHHGWNDDLSIDRISNPYPDDVAETLFGKKQEENETNEDNDDDELDDVDESESENEEEAEN